MKQPAWKKWLSYLCEYPIEKGSSELNPDLQLGLKKGRYCLSTPNAIYSYGDLYDNFSKTFQKINIQEKDLNEVLVLGFGLGSIPFMLENNFNQKSRFTGVEADELIACWAAQYVIPKMKSSIQMHLNDALSFVELCEEKFDLIAMDIFVDNTIPKKFETVEFLESLKSLLNKNGILLYNRLAFREEDRLQTEHYFNTVFKSIFPNAGYLDLGGNWMLLSNKA